MASYLTEHATFVKRSFFLKAFSSTEHPLSVLYPKACVTTHTRLPRTGRPSGHPSRRALAREFRVRNGAVRNTPWAWQVAHAKSFAGASPCAPIAVQRAASGLATPAAGPRHRYATRGIRTTTGRPPGPFARRATGPSNHARQRNTHGNAARQNEG